MGDVGRVASLVPGRGWQELGRTQSTICWPLFEYRCWDRWLTSGWEAEARLKSEQTLQGRFAVGGTAPHESEPQGGQPLPGVPSARLNPSFWFNNRRS